MNSPSEFANRWLLQVDQATRDGIETWQELMNVMLDNDYNDSVPAVLEALESTQRQAREQLANRRSFDEIYDDIERLEAELEESLQADGETRSQRTEDISRQLQALDDELGPLTQDSFARPRQDRPDVLQGDTERSRSGFDTAEGFDAAVRGTTTENRFDNTTEFPTPDSIMEALDGIMRELEELTPSQTRQKMALEKQMAEAQAALQRRIPGRGRRGTRLNMGIDPTQLGEAARGLWNNIRRAIQKRLSRTERLEYPGSQQILDRENWDTDEFLNAIRNDAIDDVFDEGAGVYKDRLTPGEAFEAGGREALRRRSERR